MTAKASGGALMERAAKAATDAPAKQAAGEIVAGPFPVGNIGSVSVVERSQGATKHLYASYQPHSGRTQRIPLAAVSTLAESLE